MSENVLFNHSFIHAYIQYVVNHETSVTVNWNKDCRYFSLFRGKLTVEFEVVTLYVFAKLLTSLV